MSLPVGRPTVPVSRDAYIRNSAQLDAMQQLLDGMKAANEEGHAEFERRERELQERMAAGEHARREQSRQQAIIDDAEQARRELARLQEMRNQLTIKSGVPTAAPQPMQMASSSARIEEISSPPNIAATASSSSSNQPSYSSSNHNPNQQHPSQARYNRYFQPHSQIQAYPTLQQNQPMLSRQLQNPPHGVQPAYGYQHLPNGTHQSIFQARPSGSTSYNGATVYLSRTNQSNTNDAMTNGTGSSGRVAGVNAVFQQINNPSNLQSNVPSAASTTMPTVVFDDDRLLEVFSGSVNMWAKEAPDNSNTFSPRLQLYVFKGQDQAKDKNGQPKRTVSVQVKESSGRMRIATREDLVSRLRLAYVTYNCVPPLQSPTPGSTQVAQNVPSPQLPVSPNQLYTSTPLTPQTSTSQSSHQTGVRTVFIPSSTLNSNAPLSSTPKPQSSITEENSSSSSRTPAQAYRPTLAKDILRGLAPKRPRTDDQGSPSDNGRETKRQALSDSLGVGRPAQQSHLVQSTLQQAQSISQQAQPMPQQMQPILQQPQPSSQQNTAQVQSIAARVRPHDPPMRETAVLRPNNETVVQKERPQADASDEGEVSSPPIVTIDLSESISSPSPPPPPTSPAPEMHASTSSPSRKSVAKSPPKRSPSKSKLEVLIIDETPPSSPPPATPLFLASPVLSTSEMIVDSPDQRMMNRKAKSRKIAFRIDCIEIPPPPDWVREDLEGMEWKKGKQFGRAQVHQGSNRRIVVSDTEDLFGDDSAAKRSLAACVEKAYSVSHRVKGVEKDPEEQAVVKLATSRLQSLPCTWQSCDAVMNSAAGLEQHLIRHVKSMGHQEVYTCRWQQCGRSESRREKLATHVVSHALLSLQCPYSGCEEGFRQPRQLLQHSRRCHSNSPVKPSADPFVPTASSPPMCPDNLPSYMVVARKISPYSISRERHDAIGPVILKNIMPPTNASWKRNKTLSPSKRTGVQPSDAILEDEYEFVAYRPSPSYRPSTAAKIRTLDDLQSARVSELAQKGLTLWGTTSLDEFIDEKPLMSEIKETPATEIIHVQ